MLGDLARFSNFHEAHCDAPRIRGIRFSVVKKPLEIAMVFYGVYYRAICFLRHAVYTIQMGPNGYFQELERSFYCRRVHVVHVNK
jgi:hypothetical protein